MTQLTNWQKQPDGIIGNVFAFLDPQSGYSLGAAHKRTSNLFFSLMERLIPIHFHCSPSPTLSPIDHHRALTIASTPYSVSLLSDPEMQLRGPVTSDFKVSSDLTHGLSIDATALFLWDLTNGQLLHTFAGHTSVIESCHFSKDGSWALTKSPTEIKIWDLDNKNCLQTIAEPNLLQAEEFYISPDSSLRKALVIFPLKVQLWDFESEKCLLNIKSEGNSLHHSTPAISDSGEIILTCLGDGRLLLYSLITGKCLTTINTKDPEIDCLAISTNKAYSTSNSMIKIWDLVSGQLLQTIDTSPNLKIDSLHITANENKIISNNWDGSVSIWHQPTGKLLETIELADRNEVECKKISPDGTRALLANNALTVQVLHLAALPHHRIYNTAMLCLRNHVEARVHFKELPSFVTKGINVFGSRIPDRLCYERLCDYSKTDLVPGIADLFHRSDKAVTYKEKQYFADPAFHRFQLLPPNTRKRIYKALELVHRNLGNLQGHKTIPENYGEQAFHNNGSYSATHKERWMALKEMVPPKALARTPSLIRKRLRTAK